MNVKGKCQAEERPHRKNHIACSEWWTEDSEVPEST